MIHKDVIIVGAGISGLSAAKILCEYDLEVLIIERNDYLGGQLQKHTHFYPAFDQKRGINLIHNLIGDLNKYQNLEIKVNTTASAIYEDLVLTALHKSEYLKNQARSYLFATGSIDKNLAFENNDLPGIFPSSVIQSMIHLYGIKPENKVMIVGSGNTALITAIYLHEAGVDVSAIVESSQQILGDTMYIHKIEHLGIPMYLEYQIEKAIGEKSVEAVKLLHVKDQHELLLEHVQTICIASGLSPLTQLLNMAGVKMEYKSYLGGFVPILNEMNQTSNPNIFACGDVTGIEDAEIAMYEGYLAALGTLNHLGIQQDDIDQKIHTYQQKLHQLKEKMHQHQHGLKEGPYVL